MIFPLIFRFKEAAWYYVKAERWNEAHEIIMNNLVTNAIINGECFDFVLWLLLLAEGIKIRTLYS